MCAFPQRYYQKNYSIYDNKAQERLANHPLSLNWRTLIEYRDFKPPLNVYFSAAEKLYLLPTLEKPKNLLFPTPVFTYLDNIYTISTVLLIYKTLISAENTHSLSGHKFTYFDSVLLLKFSVKHLQDQIHFPKIL